MTLRLASCGSENKASQSIWKSLILYECADSSPRVIFLSGGKLDLTCKPNTKPHLISVNWPKLLLTTTFWRVGIWKNDDISAWTVVSRWELFTMTLLYLTFTLMITCVTCVQGEPWCFTKNDLTNSTPFCNPNGPMRDCGEYYLHGVFLKNSDPMDIVLSNNTMQYKVIGGIPVQ